MNASLAEVRWPINTARLTLRRLVEQDLEATWSYRRLPEVSEWITAAPEDFETYKAQFLESGKIDRDIAVEIETAQGPRLIGTVMLYVKDAWGQREVVEQAKSVEAELGWSFDPQFTGQGYATEAVSEVLRICFEDLKLRRVVAECFTANVPSFKLMERVGMRRESHQKASGLHRSGQWLDGYSYAMLKDEWAQRRRP